MRSICIKAHVRSEITVDNSQAVSFDVQTSKNHAKNNCSGENDLFHLDYFASLAGWLLLRMILDDDIKLC